MKLYKKQAFSLTELLIVLVVVAVLFAALAPIFTKRRHGTVVGDEPVWMFVNNDDQKDAYYDPGMPKALSTAFVGVKPDSVLDKTPYSKVIVKATKHNNKPQNIIQFRYGSGNGTLTGIFAADTNGNYLNTTRLNGTPAKNYNDLLLDGTNNTALGSDAMSKMKSGSNSVAIGSSAMNETESSSYTTAVGSNAGKKAGSANVIIGANSGAGNGIANNVILGANSMSLNESVGNSNVVVGANVAVSGLKNGTEDEAGIKGFATSSGNVVLSARTIGADYFKNSTVIGYGAYNGAKQSATDLTAIGYNACSSFESDKNPMQDGGARTCIGPTTGQARNYAPMSFFNDPYDHVFLGGAPIGGYPGLSVLEVHNIKTSHSITGVKPNVGPTVVLNSNLVVRGNLYFPRVSDGVLVAHASGNLKYGKKRQNRDWCTKGCCFRIIRRWKCSDFKERNGCNIIADIFDFIVNPFVKIVFETFNFNLGKWGVIFGNFDGFKADNDGREVAEEPETGTAMLFLPNTECSSHPSLCPKLKVSDIRLKENISENNVSLDKLLNVMPYNYSYKADKNAVPQVGVMAQDLEIYMPNAVSKDKNGFLQIRWDEMFYASINSIKELDSKLEGLISETATLEKDTLQVAQDQKSVKNRIEEMNRRLNKLEK